ncbi:MAG: hypothetical protein K0R71_1936 [Bacillales bacterium]|nr:hypothetical protein [Bacillales bacterium]
MMSTFKVLGNVKNEIVTELERAKSDFATEIEKTEKILKCIDVRKVEPGAPAYGFFSANNDAAVHIFIYETDKNLYVLMCNILGQKVKHVKLEFSDLRLEIINGQSNGKIFELIGKDGWYIRGRINTKSRFELQDLASKRNIPISFKKEGYFKTFFPNPILLLWWLFYLGAAIAAFFVAMETIASL